MLFVFTALSLLAFTSATDLADDFNCTTVDKLWAPNAVACDNNIEDSVCDILVSSPPSIVVGTKSDDRAPLCKKDSNGPNEQLKESMIKMCPKTCGYCCMTPQYNCKNKELPAMNCATVKPAQCKDPKWREVIATECPSVCGFCLEGGCVDAVVECANDITICRNIDLQGFVQQNCKKTCGFCTNNGGNQGTGTDCRDMGTNCALWYKNGFCSNPFYTILQKQAYCAQTCGMCPNSNGMNGMTTTASYYGKK